MEKIKTDKIILVEGKYDKIKLSSFIDGVIMTTSGFAVFNNEEKCNLLRKLASEKGIIILTDSDGAGFVIRNKLKGIIGADGDIINLYIPKVEGVEDRKKTPSKQGLLGVEGIDAPVLKEIFEKAGVLTDKTSDSKKYTKTDLYCLGYSGKEDSSSKRDEVLSKNGLPCGMSANAFLEAVNLLNIEL